jgi:hypothetical protein
MDVGAIWGPFVSFGDEPVGVAGAVNRALAPARETTLVCGQLRERQSNP